jgi:hypothetical protein
MMAKTIAPRSNRTALDKLSYRLDELLDLYERMALHVGFVDERTQLISQSANQARAQVLIE